MYAYNLAWVLFLQGVIIRVYAEKAEQLQMYCLPYLKIIINNSLAFNVDILSMYD